jgi:phosphatidylinositol alpha 1,6-mannosyltransferase
MRIVFFTETCEPHVNGVVVTLNRVTEYLSSQGHEILLVAPRYSGTQSNSHGVRMKCVPFPLYPEMPIILPHWSFHRTEFEKIGAFQPDLVHVWTPGVMSFFAQTWARRRGCPVVASYETDLIRYLHIYGFGAFESQAWRYFKWLLNNCRRTYVPSHDTKTFLDDAGIRNVEVFERGVDIRRFNPEKRSIDVRKTLGADEDDLLILYVGRLSNEKELPILFNSFLKLLGQYPTARLAITGEGPGLRGLLRKFSHPNIVFTGVRRGGELASLFASADIFALPSSTETLSIASLEAMASGIPVLGMNAGGIRDIVKHRETGLLANTADEFGMYLRQLAAGASQRRAFGRDARIYAESKTWDHSLAALERSYLDLVPPNGRAAS